MRSGLKMMTTDSEQVLDRTVNYPLGQNHALHICGLDRSRDSRVHIRVA